MQLSAELPCVTGGQQGSLLQLVLLFVKVGLPCQLEPAELPILFFFYDGGFLFCGHTWFFCNSGSGYWYSTYCFFLQF